MVTKNKKQGDTKCFKTNPVQKVRQKKNNGVFVFFGRKYLKIKFI